MNTKHVLIAASVATLALGSLSFAAVNGARNFPKNDVLKTAIETKDYASVPEALRTKITEENFAQMVEKNTLHTAVENAVKSGNYTAFREAMIAQIPTEAEFQDMVTKNATREATQSAIETAVKNNDFAAFKTAIEKQKAVMNVDHPEMGDKAPKMDDSKLLTHFNTLVEYYKTNGEMPEMGRGFGPGMRDNGALFGPGFGGKGARNHEMK